MKYLLISLLLTITITSLAQDIETQEIKIVDANGTLIGNLNKSPNSNDFIIGSLGTIDIQSLLGAIEFKNGILNETILKIENNKIQLPNVQEINDFTSIQAPMVMDGSNNVNKLNSHLIRIDPKFGGIPFSTSGIQYDLDLPHFVTLDSIVLRALNGIFPVTNISFSITNVGGRTIPDIRDWDCSIGNLHLFSGSFTSCPVDNDSDFKIWDKSGLGTIKFDNASEIIGLRYILIYYHYH